MKIIPYEDGYRDDMIFMVLEAKNALGRVPGAVKTRTVWRGAIPSFMDREGIQL